MGVDISAPSEVQNHFLALFHVVSEIIVSAPTLQLFHLLPATRFNTVCDASNHFSIVRKFTIGQPGWLGEQSYVSSVNRRGLGTQPWGESVLRRRCCRSSQTVVCRSGSSGPSYRWKSLVQMRSLFLQVRGYHGVRSRFEVHKEHRIYDSSSPGGWVWTTEETVSSVDPYFLYAYWCGT